MVLGAVVAAASYLTSEPQRGRSTERFNPEPIFASNEDGREFSGEVAAVVDGDTLDVAWSGAPRRIRLYGIDCPELNQAFGLTARLLTSDMALHKVVMVHVRGRDKYGRTIGEVIFPDGRMLNQELIKAGMAWWYRKYSDDSQFAALESEARSKRIGLWSDPAPVAPWEFRDRH